VTVQCCIDSRRQSVNRAGAGLHWIASIIGLAVICCGCSVGFASELSLFTGGNHTGMKGPFAVLGQGQSSLSWFSWFCFFCSFFFLHPSHCLHCSPLSACLTIGRRPDVTQRRHPSSVFIILLQNQALSSGSCWMKSHSPAKSSTDSRLQPQLQIGAPSGTNQSPLPPHGLLLMSTLSKLLVVYCPWLSAQATPVILCLLCLLCCCAVLACLLPVDTDTNRKTPRIGTTLRCQR